MSRFAKYFYAFDVSKMQQAIIRDQWHHLHLMEPHWVNWSHLGHGVLAFQGLDFEGHCLDVGPHQHELLDVATSSDEILKCHKCLSGVNFMRRS